MLNHLQRNYLQKYQQVYPQSTQWSNIQYKLQLNLGDTSVYLQRVYCVVNPYLNQQFQKQNKGMIISQVYVKPQKLTGSNRIQRVCQKGFEISQQKGGLEFTMGQISGIQCKQPSNEQQNFQELLMVKICPRKTYPCASNAITQAQSFRPPEGFDSVIYKQNAQQKTENGQMGQGKSSENFQQQSPYNMKNQNSQIYQHRFKIFKKNQTLPYYFIQFSFKTVNHQKVNLIKCQKCQAQQGNVYCFTQKVYFCKKCDYQHHKDKISSKHQRKIIKDEPILDFGHCSNHKLNKNQLFCKQCNYPMCMSCKIYGDHSEGIMSTHKLQRVSDYYEAIQLRLKQMQPNLQKRKNQFEQLLNIIHNKMIDINETTSMIQKQLKIMFQDALKSLQAISHRKLSYLISDQLEMRRQYDYIQWMQSFLNYQFDILPPHSFLTSWTKHVRLRKQVLNLANIPSVSQVKLDYKILGQVRVQQDGKIIMASSSHKGGGSGSMASGGLGENGVGGNSGVGGVGGGDKNILKLKRQLHQAKKDIIQNNGVIGGGEGGSVVGGIGGLSDPLSQHQQSSSALRKNLFAGIMGVADRSDSKNERERDRQKVGNDKVQVSSATPATKNNYNGIIYDNNLANK